MNNQTNQQKVKNSKTLQQVNQYYLVNTENEGIYIIAENMEQALFLYNSQFTFPLTVITSSGLQVFMSK
jgi:hypothetical protein